MSIKQEFREAREKFRLLSLYQRFEHFVVMFLTALIVVIVVAADPDAEDPVRPGSLGRP